MSVLLSRIANCAWQIINLSAGQWPRHLNIQQRLPLMPDGPVVVSILSWWVQFQQNQEARWKFTSLIKRELLFSCTVSTLVALPFVYKLTYR